MASLLFVCLLGLFTFTIRTEAQGVNSTVVQVTNSTGPTLLVNLTSTAQSELPPGGLPEIIVNPALKKELPPEGVPELISNPAVKVNLSPKEVIANPPVNTTTILSPVAVLPQSPEENPLIAAKRMNIGGVKTPLAIDPDAVPVKVLGSRCMGPKECLKTINNTSCIGGICDCISGFIPSKHSLDKCIKVPTGLGDDCEEEAQCAHVVPGSECRAGKCFCPPNFVLDLSRCWEKQLLGGVCNSSLQCDSVTFSLCAQGVCACQPPLIPSPNSNKCLPSAGAVYKALCEEDIQCTDSYGDEAHCSNSQCICTNDYHFNGSTCLADRNLGDSCLSDEDCAVSDVSNVQGSRACIGQHCGCASGYAVLPGEDICTVTIDSSAEELAVSFSWFLCIVIAKYYLS